MDKAAVLLKDFGLGYYEPVGLSVSKAVLLGIATKKELLLNDANEPVGAYVDFSSLGFGLVIKASGDGSLVYKVPCKSYSVVVKRKAGKISKLQFINAGMVLTVFENGEIFSKYLEYFAKDSKSTKGNASAEYPAISMTFNIDGVRIMANVKEHMIVACAFSTPDVVRDIVFEEFPVHHISPRNIDGNLNNSYSNLLVCSPKVHGLIHDVLKGLARQSNIYDCGAYSHYDTSLIIRNVLEHARVVQFVEVIPDLKVLVEKLAVLPSAIDERIAFGDYALDVLGGNDGEDLESIYDDDGFYVCDEDMF